MYICMIPSQLGVRISATQNSQQKSQPSLSDFQLLTLNSSTRLRLPEIQLHVEFFLKQLRASIRVPQVFRCIASSVHLQTDRTPLKRSAQLHHPLSVRMIQCLGDSQNRGQSPSYALVRVVQRRIGRVMSR